MNPIDRQYNALTAAVLADELHEAAGRVRVRDDTDRYHKRESVRETPDERLRRWTSGPWPEIVALALDIDPDVQAETITGVCEGRVRVSARTGAGRRDRA